MSVNQLSLRNICVHFCQKMFLNYARLGDELSADMRCPTTTTLIYVKVHNLQN